MNKNKIKTGVPWSRHLVVSPESQQNFSSEEVAKAHNRLRKIKAGLSEGQKRASSEINLWTGENITGEVDECWDSQSDPGSASPGKNRRFSSSVCIHKEDENKSEDMDEDVTINPKKQKSSFPNKERNGSDGTESFELRRRKGAQFEGNSGNGDFVIEIPEEALSASDVIGYPLNCTRNYVHTSFDFMYYCCVSSYKWDNMKNVEITRRQYSLSIIQRIIAVYVAIMATFTSVSFVKIFILDFLADRTLYGFIDIGYFVTAAAFQLYVTYFLATHQDMISTTMKGWTAYESKTFDLNHNEINKTKWLPIFNGLIIVALAALKQVIIYDSTEDFILGHSKDTMERILLWTPEQFGNKTFIKEKYGTDLNLKSYTIGIFGFISSFCFNLQVDCFKDLLIWIAVVNRQHILAYGREVKENLFRKTKTGKNSKEMDDHCWNLYRDVKRINSHTTSTFKKMIILSHVYSFLTFSFFLTFVLNEQASFGIVMMVGYNTIKGILPYLPARTASRENQRCQKWIQTLPCETKRFRVGETPITREFMLWELDREPLGLGSGQVHINNEFLFTFLTFVASLFCFLFNLEQKDERVVRY